MSSQLRNIERMVKRTGYTHTKGHGSRLGVRNPKDTCLLARKARDAKWGRNCGTMIVHMSDKSSN